MVGMSLKHQEKVIDTTIFAWCQTAPGDFLISLIKGGKFIVYWFSGKWNFWVRK
jgi:hypothetical protein